MSKILLILIFIMITVLQSVSGLKHSIIGKYAKLNPKDCGISRTTSLLNQCFKYHKNMWPEMKKGRDATLGEAPWANLIIVKISLITRDGTLYSMGQCTGSFFADTWIITAAHCAKFDMTGDSDVISVKLKPMVFSGYKTGLLLTNQSFGEYLINETHIHPNYEELKNESIPKNDIALLRLNASISDETQFGLRLENNICLPEHKYKEDSDELVMSAGHGSHGYPYNLTNGYDRRPLQLGYRKVVLDAAKALNVSGEAIDPSYLVTFVADNQTLVCQGDSGGPVWTFDQGRAVLLGVLSVGNVEGDSCTSEEGFAIYTRISEFIPWIKEVTKLD